MTDAEVDYSNTIFYKLRCADPLNKSLFVGHTVDFSASEERHRTLSKVDEAAVHREIREGGGWENWRMEMLGVRDCANQSEAQRVEKEFARSLGGQMLSETSNFHCAACDYRCTSKFLWRQHCSTKKHLRKTTEPAIDAAAADEVAACGFNCEGCSKNYKQRSGLWRHRKRCRSKGVRGGAVSVLDIKEIMHDMLANDTKMKEEMMSQMRQQNKIIQDMIPKMGNNNNNKFNINVFLNEHCRDAINMSDFLESLQLQVGDLLYSKDNGLIQGVSTILLKGLRELDTYKRPIHCTDVKRETLYIKDNDAWERDNCKEKLKSAITDVASRQRNLITAWEEVNPGWRESDSGKDEYIQLVRTVMDDMNEGKVIRNIAKEMVVDKM